MTLYMPLTRLTRNLVGAEELAMMQPGALLINACLITPRMGSMSVDCRRRMEYGAARIAVAFLRDEPFDELVPESKYVMRVSEREPVESRRPRASGSRQGCRSLSPSRVASPAVTWSRRSSRLAPQSAP